jgi:hypothetical protein
MQNVAHLLRLIFAPKWFIDVVTDLVVVEDRVKNPSWLQPEGEFQIKRRAEIQENVRNQTNRFRRGIAKGIVTTALTIAVGAIAGTALRYLFGEPAKALVYFIQASGAAVILGATLAEVGGDISTWKRESIPEQLNRLIFRGLYVAGTFLFVLSVAWDAA